MTTRLLVNIALLTVATTAAAGGTGGDAAGTDSSELKRIADGIVAARSGVRSLRIVVDRRPKTPVQDGAMLGGKEIFAFKDELRSIDNTAIIKKMVITTESVKTIDGKPQVVNERSVLNEGINRFVAVFDGARMIMHGGGNVAQMESLATREANPGSRFDCHSVRQIGWYVRDPMGPDGFEQYRESGALPDVFVRNGYRISSDSVNGTPAVKLEGDPAAAPAVGGVPAFQGNERIWLDERRGFMLLRRELGDRDGALVVDCVTGDPIELAEGCWVPRLCTIHSAQYGVSELRLVEWRVNDLSDSEFKIEVPPNAMVIDRAETAARWLPPTNPLVRYSSGAGELMDQPLKAVFAERRRQRWVYIFLATLLAGLVAVAWKLGPRRVSSPGG